MSQSKKLLKVDDFPTECLSSINSQRESGFLCDIKLIVENEKFPTHRTVLAASSDFFATMFKTNMKEKYADTIKLKEVTPEAVKLILDFLYSGEIELSMENRKEVLYAASMMQIKSLLNIIDKHLLETVDPSNSLELKKISELFSLSALQQKTEDCILENFGEVCLSKKFLELTDAELKIYLKSDDIVVDSEEHLFTALAAWTNHDLENRENKFFSLFTLIQLRKIKETSHDICLLTPYNSMCQVRVGNAVFAKQMKQPEMHISFASAVVVHQGKVFFFGGLNPNNNNQHTANIISFDGKKWKNEGNLNCARANATAVSAAGSVFIFCGEKYGGLVSGIERFTEGTSPTNIAFNSSYYRSCPVAIVVGDVITVIGGYACCKLDAGSGGQNVYVSTSQYNVKNGQVFEGRNKTSNLNHGRAEFGACAIGNRIYVFGGKTSANGGFVNSVEYLDGANIFGQRGNWTLVTMSFQLGMTSVCLFNDHQLLVLGEESDELRCFDLDQLTWKKEVTVDKAQDKGKKMCKLGSAPKGSKMFRLKA